MPAYVQDANAHSSSASIVTVTLGSDTAAGDTIIASICLPAAASVVSIVDSLGDPWIQAAFAKSPATSSEIWYSRGIIAGACTATVTFSADITAGVNVAEFSGLYYVDPLDSWTQAFSTLATESVPSSFVQPRGENELAVAVVSSNGAVTGAPSGFTALTESGNSGFAAAYSVLSSSVAPVPEWTGDSAVWAVVIATFLPGEAGINPRFQFPETLVEVSTDPTFLDPITGNGIWTNISQYVRSMTLGPIGRQHELDRVQASTAQIVVNNRVDGSFNSWNTESFLTALGPGTGLTVMSPVKVTAAWDGITENIFYGYLQAMIPTLGDELNTDVQINAVDILQMLSLKYLSNNNYAQAVLADAPEAYYRLGDSTTSNSVIDVTGDSIGSLVDGAQQPAYGAIGPFLYDTSTALDLTNGVNVPGGGFNTNDNTTQPPTIYDPLDSASSFWSFECWFQWTGTAIPAPATTNPTVEVIGVSTGSSGRRRAATFPTVTLPSTTASVAAVPNGVLAHFTASVAYEFQLGYAGIVGESGGLPHTPIVFPFSDCFIIAGGGGRAIFTWPQNPLDGNWHHLFVSVNPMETLENIATVTVGTSPAGVAITPDGSLVYVTNESDGTVSVILTSSNTVVATITVGSDPTGVAITPDGSTAYVTNSGAGTVSVIDVLTNAVVGSPITVGSTPRSVAITPDGTLAYVTNESGSTLVSIINTGSNTVTGTIMGTSHEPFAIAITPDGLHAYMVNHNNGTVSVIDTGSNTITATISVGTSPSGIAITPDGSTVYVSNFGSVSVSVIATISNTVITTVTTAPDPIGVAISPDGLIVYVTTFAPDIQFISTITNTLVSSIVVGSQPVSVVAAPNDVNVYVANSGDGTVSVVGNIAQGIDVYLDAVLASEMSQLDVVTSFVAPVGFTIGCPPPGTLGFDPLGGTNNAQGLPGIISDVALYSQPLEAQAIARHYSVGKWFQSQETGASVQTTTGGRFNKVMEVAGLDPSTMLVIPYPWLTTLYAETNVITTTSALNYMQTTTQSEPGLIYQGPDGLIYAFNRQYQYINPTSVTSQGLFADAASVQLHYDNSLEITRDDLDTWNDIQVQSGASGDLNSNFFAGAVGNASGAVLQEWGPIQSTNAARSAEQFGSRTLQGLTSLQMQNDSDALAIAQNYGAWYNFPIPRVTQMTINSQGAGGNNIAQILARRIYDRITVQYNGQTAGPPFEQDALIESMTHTIQMDNGPTWTTTYALSPYEILFSPFILDQSTLDGPDVLTL